MADRCARCDCLLMRTYYMDPQTGQAACMNCMANIESSRREPFAIAAIAGIVLCLLAFDACDRYQNHAGAEGAGQLGRIAPARRAQTTGQLHFLPPVPAVEPSPLDDGGDALWSARICYLEAEFSEPDCAAIVHVGMKRGAMRGQPWIKALRAYSVLEKRQTKRARAIARYGPEVAELGDAWTLLQAFVYEVLAGKVPDTCPSAIGWGGTMDPLPPGTKPARCIAPTANTFYTLARN